MHFVTDDSMKTFSAPSSNGYTLTCVGNRISALLKRLALHMKAVRIMALDSTRKNRRL
jgi:hypothetical protein